MKQKQFNLTSLNEFFDDYTLQGWAFADHIFTADFLQNLVSECQKQQALGLFNKASIGHQSSKKIDAQIRGDFTLWLDDIPLSEPVSVFKQFLNEFRLLIAQELFVSLKRVESHFAFYPPGTNYAKHIDNHKGSGARKITFILYLNENWQKGHGGELTLFSPHDENQVLHTLEPLMGRFVLFRSELFPHQVETSLAPRLSLTGWFRDDNI